MSRPTFLWLRIMCFICSFDYCIQKDINHSYLHIMFYHKELFEIDKIDFPLSFLMPIVIFRLPTGL